MTARILVADIERISAIVQDVWTLDQRRYMNPESIIEPSRTICLAWKWLGEKKIHFAAEWDEGGHKGMIEKAHSLLDECTHFVGWNSAAFDVKHLRSHFFQYDLKPPSPHVDVDLLKVSRRNFAFMSNRMAYVADVLGLDGKADTKKGLWHDLRSEKRGVVKRAQQQMSHYNKRDVELTEELFYIMRPWVPNLNLALYEEPKEENAGVPQCPNCLSWNMQRQGMRRAATRVYQRFQCSSCGKWSQGSKSLFGVEARGI
jgi:hypothetical protein